MKPGHALITGASSGIGEALARALAAGGHRVTLAARRKGRLEALAREIGAAHVVEVDLTDPGEVPDLVASAEAAFGPIDLLVNNAGQQIVDYTWEIDPDAGEAMVRLNLLTPLRLIRTVLPSMRERGAGRIVNISSVAGYAAPLGMAWYAASKAGLATASETLAGELRGSGVHVLTVYPGPVRTEMGTYGEERIESDFTTRIQPWGTPEELADLILKSLRRRRLRLVYPSTYSAVRHFPGPARWVIDRFAPRLRPEG